MKRARYLIQRFAGAGFEDLQPAHARRFVRMWRRARRRDGFPIYLVEKVGKGEIRAIHLTTGAAATLRREQA